MVAGYRFRRGGFQIRPELIINQLLVNQLTSLTMKSTIISISAALVALAGLFGYMEYRLDYKDSIIEKHTDSIGVLHTELRLKADIIDSLVNREPEVVEKVKYLPGEPVYIPPDTAAGDSGTLQGVWQVTARDSGDHYRTLARYFASQPIPMGRWELQTDVDIYPPVVVERKIEVPVKIQPPDWYIGALLGGGNHSSLAAVYIRWQGFTVWGGENLVPGNIGWIAGLGIEIPIGESKK